ncbi:MAG: flagellar biosynthesis protein FlhF, partial [Variovorax sp.]
MTHDVRTTARKFVAATSREALRLVREALGAEAIVLTNRACADGVEIVAMAEGDVNAAVAQVASPVPARVIAAPMSPRIVFPSTPQAELPSAPPPLREAPAPA